ncbi:MAG TPA: VWA domain-containing protein [Thermoanaerobaculia bacterium]|nr:VWA domain-containing protein [Thermoanaerobaculia bacterium]
MRRLLPCILILALAAVAAQAQQTFTEVTDVVVVEVPVQVLRDGEPVRGLTSADFEVYEGRKKLPVTGFEVLDLTVSEAPAAADKTFQAARPIAARRHFLLLFDLAFSSPKALAQARQAAEDLIEGLHPVDLVAVASYLPSKGPQLLLGFTSDKAQIANALSLLGKPQMFDRMPDPLRLVLGAGAPGGGGGGASGSGSGAAGGRSSARKEAIAEAFDDPSGTFTSMLEAETGRAARSAQQKAIAAMSRAFADLAKTMAALYGRKYVVLFSEGFDSAVYQGTANMDEQLTMAAESAFGQIWGVDNEQRFGSTKSANDLEKMLEEFRRADCVIQSVDIGGLRERGGPESQWVGGRDSLFLMADSTGGELYENFNDLSAAMGQMLKRTSVTYVLAFQPEAIKRDGNYHRLRVEVKNAPKGTRVVHRPGYYAPKPFGEQSATERMLQTAQQVVSGVENGAIPISVLAAAFPTASPAAGQESYVPVLVEVDGPSLLAGHPAGKPLPAEIYVYAMNHNGTVVDYVTQSLGLDLAKVEPALRQSGIKFFGHLDLPPGDYSVRVLVRNGATGTAGLKVATVSVPAFAASDPVLLPAFFPEPAGKWLIVREAAQEGDRQVPYPFMAGEEPYIPASLPAVGPGEEAPVALVGYHLRDGDLQAEARILTAEGREAGAGEVRVVRRFGRGADGADRVAAAFKAPRLKPGEYLLMITLTDPSGAAETSVTPFVVKGGAGMRPTG